MVFRVWLLSLSVMFSRLIHTIACVNTLFLFYGRMIVHYMDIPICLFINWWIFGYFGLLWIMLLFVFKFLYGHLLNPFGHVPRIELLGLMVTIFNLLKNCQTVFHNGCAVYITTSNLWGFFVSPYPYQHLLLSFFITAILGCVKW